MRLQAVDFLVDCPHHLRDLLPSPVAPDRVGGGRFSLSPVLAVEPGDCDLAVTPVLARVAYEVEHQTVDVVLAQ